MNDDKASRRFSRAGIITVALVATAIITFLVLRAMWAPCVQNIKFC